MKGKFINTIFLFLSIISFGQRNSIDTNFVKQTEKLTYTTLFGDNNCFGTENINYCVLHCNCLTDSINNIQTEFIKLSSGRILNNRKNGEWKYYHPNSIDCCLTHKNNSILDSIVYYRNGIKICSNDSIVIDSIRKGICINTEYEDKTLKPVIYLYPKTPIEITLEINYNGIIKTSYPKYKNGWKITAYPDGKMINKEDDKEYYNLYWDGETNYSNQHITYENGYIISKDTALIFLQNILSKTGLSPREYNDFIMYWLPYIEKNEFTFIHFLFGNEYNSISQNIINPTPDTEIRVFIEFKKVDSFFLITPQNIISQKRDGYLMVEWGGSEINKPIQIKMIEGKYITK